ncbi:Putative peptidase M20, bacterial exopeptidase dimerization domain-containing protein [Septoria linicola]|uniref:Peptidase M20, bacterial exopeptidase dimerization domain-containing protein n=1 Tax=Septoria linicola TaxID=215465 RepID=A0A9Q9EPG0_9PEZI|nr:putative peptidase M20, bacterial exopeptidase dimerization domain-containing protein [Septoria linicola]USW57677.1 Putative peptidase M20, bacterial exopeptidase dimerization domain-containing protein [Septoria linicola]
MRVAELIFAFGLVPCSFASLPPSTQDPILASSSKLLLGRDLVDFHKSLVEIESISGNEKAVGDWLYESLKSQGYNAEKQYVSNDPERFNVYAWPGDKREAPVILSSHIDTVPPFLPYKYTKHEKNNTIFGRGSVDAKGSVATQVIAVNELMSKSAINPNDVAVLYVVGEEVGGAGMQKANDLNLTPKTVIFGEPTELKLVSGHKGILQVVLTAKGKAAHSGYPWLGRSANEVLVSALAAIMQLGDKLPQSDKYGTTTFNIGRMQGGVANNVVAQDAKAQIAVRIAEGTPALIEKEVTIAVHDAVKDFLIKDDLKAEDIITIDFSGAGYGPIDIDHDVPGFDVMTVNYGTDIPWLNKTVKDQKRYLYGPGTIFVAHSDHEELKEQDLYDAVEGYKKIVLHALGKGGEGGREDL